MHEEKCTLRVQIAGWNEQAVPAGVNGPGVVKSQDWSVAAALLSWNEQVIAERVNRLEWSIPVS